MISVYILLKVLKVGDDFLYRTSRGLDIIFVFFSELSDIFRQIVLFFFTFPPMGTFSFTSWGL